MKGNAMYQIVKVDLKKGKEETNNDLMLKKEAGERRRNKQQQQQQQQQPLHACWLQCNEWELNM